MQTVDQSGAILGSIHYMAPEQFEQIPLDVRSDLYSLGCVLYYGLTQRYPFNGESSAQVMASHLQGRKPPMQNLRSDLPQPLVIWLDKMTARQPDGRFASAAEALAALRNIHESTLADPTGLSPLPREQAPIHDPADLPTNRDIPPTVKTQLPVTASELPPRKSNKTGLIFGIIMSLLIIGGFGYWLIRKPGNNPAETASSQVFTPVQIGELRERRGSEVILAGKVKKAAESKSGKTRYLNFSWPPGKTVPLTFSTEGNDAVSLKVLESYEGKTVEARGEVEIIFGKTYVKVASLDQLQVK